jgi:D-glycero-alpha-D-manno-heptose 1-phosphate guanylyltransferase
VTITNSQGEVAHSRSRHAVFPEPVFHRALEFSTCCVLVLVGGLGTRLRTAYADGPKALAPIQGRPFLAYILKLLSDAGLSRIVLCVGYRAEQIEQWLGDGTSLGLQVKYSREEEPLGTAGAIALAYSRYAKGERVLAMNGDSILQLPLAAMWDVHMRRLAEATVALAQVQDASRYGSVGVNREGWVTSFREKGSGKRAGLINGGVYLFEPAVLDAVVQRGSISLEREVLPNQLQRGLLAFKTDGYFIDIGIPQDFARAQAELGAVVGF